MTSKTADSCLSGGYLYFASSRRMCLRSEAAPERRPSGDLQFLARLMQFPTVGVEPRGLEPGVAHQLGHGHDVDALAGQLGAEGVTQQVAGHLVLEPGGRG